MQAKWRIAIMTAYQNWTERSFNSDDGDDGFSNGGCSK